MNRNENATCQTCPYWAGGGDDDKAECRRRGPVAIATPDHPKQYAIDMWPETESDEWCGEHPDFARREVKP